MMITMNFADRQSRLGSLVLDVLVSEEINLEAEVTRYPVEDGTVISDHITQGPETLRISGLVSTADVLAFSFASPGQTKLIDAIEALRAMHRDRTTITVSTGQMLYRDMAFTSMRAIRSNGERGGNWLEIHAELAKVRKVKLRTAEVPEKVAQGDAKGRAGKTNTPAGKSSSSSQQAGAAAEPAKVTPLYRIAQGTGMDPQKLLESLKSQLGLRR